MRWTPLGYPASGEGYPPYNAKNLRQGLIVTGPGITFPPLSAMLVGEPVIGPRAATHGGFHFLKPGVGYVEGGDFG